MALPLLREEVSCGRLQRARARRSQKESHSASPLGSTNSILSRWSVQITGIQNDSGPQELFCLREQRGCLTLPDTLPHRSARTSSLRLTPCQTRRPLQQDWPPISLTDRQGDISASPLSSDPWPGLASGRRGSTAVIAA